MRIITAIAILGLTMTSALAWVDHPSREHHDIWKLRCYPANSDPFAVTTNSEAGGLLIIYGRNGVARSNVIESVEDTNWEFIVIANGADYKGRHREIELHVTKDGNRSHLAINRDTANEIQCGPASGASND